MSLGAGNIGLDAVKTASEQGYISTDYQYAASRGKNVALPPSRRRGGCVPESTGNFFVDIAIVVLGSTVILTKLSSQAANDTRLQANHFKAKQLQAEEASNPDAAKLFGAMSTENRIASFAYGFFATAFALFTVTAIAALAYHFGANFDKSYLIDGAIGGAGFIGLGGLTYLGSSLYKRAKRAELESATERILND